MEGYIAEIRMFAGNFNPRSWLFCSGQVLSIAQNTALFSLIGTIYGGNGQTTFALPDLRGRIPIGASAQGPGLPSYQLGEMGGVENTTLLSTNLPAHNHTLTGSVVPTAAADGLLSPDPAGRRPGPMALFSASAADLVPMAPYVVSGATAIAGNSQPFSNMPPYIGMNYIICIEGIYPSRN
jgi:microcystin-dependent protein